MLHALPPSMEHLVPLLPVNGNSFLSIFERSAMNRRCCRGGEMQLMRKDDDDDDDIYIMMSVCLFVCLSRKMITLPN